MIGIGSVTIQLKNHSTPVFFNDFFHHFIIIVLILSPSDNFQTPGFEFLSLETLRIGPDDLPLGKIACSVLLFSSLCFGLHALTQWFSNVNVYLNHWEACWTMDSWTQHPHYPRVSDSRAFGFLNRSQVWLMLSSPGPHLKSYVLTSHQCPFPNIPPFFCLQVIYFYLSIHFPPLSFRCDAKCTKLA